MNRDLYDKADTEKHLYLAKAGLNKEVVKEISKQKDEPKWMFEIRQKGFDFFKKTAIPIWGPSLNKLDLNSITYFMRPDAKGNAKNWEDVPEDIKKTFDRLGIPEAEKKFLAGAGAQYDCISEDSYVYTNPKGPIKIKDVKVSDTVFSYDEETNSVVKSKVNAIIDKGKRAVFELKVAGRTIVATFNHPLLSLVDKRKPGRQRIRYAKEWKYVSELKKGDLIAIATDLPDCGTSFTFPIFPIKHVVTGKNQTGRTYPLDISNRYNKITLPKISDEDVLWFLGLFLGDGYIKHELGKNKARVLFAIPESQNQLRQEITAICKDVFNYEIKSKNKDYIAINSTILAQFLEKIGFKGNAHTKIVPQWIMTLPKNELLAFLGGYLDSDGNVRNSKKSKDVVYTSTNSFILTSVKNICTYVGLQSSKVTTFRSYHPYDTSRIIIGHRLHVSGRTHIIKSRYDFKSVRLLNKAYFRKFNSARGTTIRKYCSDSIGFARIESIIYKGMQNVFDLSI